MSWESRIIVDIGVKRVKAWFVPQVCVNSNLRTLVHSARCIIVHFRLTDLLHIMRRGFFRTCRNETKKEPLWWCKECGTAAKIFSSFTCFSYLITKTRNIFVHNNKYVGHLKDAHLHRQIDRLLWCSAHFRSIIHSWFQVNINIYYGRIRNRIQTVRRFLYENCQFISQYWILQRIVLEFRFGALFLLHKNFLLLSVRKNALWVPMCSTINVISGSL